MSKDKLILGTVQLGLDYGINNAIGKPSLSEAHQILEEAHMNGIKYLDTAAAYGNSEEIIGQYIQSHQGAFNVITKFHVKEDESIKSQVLEAKSKLHVSSLSAVMFHSYQDFVTHSYLLEDLEELRAQGHVGQIGVSVYENEEIESLLQYEGIDLIQVPFNLLDNDYQKGAILKRARASGKTIHVRSVFLQGLFFKEAEFLPKGLMGMRGALANLKSIKHDTKISMSEMALSYVLGKEYIDGVLIGVDSTEQLKANLSVVGRTLPKNIEAQIDQIVIKENWLLNPSNWKL